VSDDFSSQAGSHLLGPHLADSLCETLVAALRRADTERRDEQAPLGIDALDEVALHPILAEGLTVAGWGVHRETRYPGLESDDPGSPAPRGSRKDNARDRCDLVLTERPGLALLDPVHADRRVRAGDGTLFADLAPAMEASASADAVRPEDAFWLEIKAVAQYAYRDGVPGPNRTYASEMVNGPAADVCKLIGDGVIENAAVALVLFTETEAVARNDAEQTAHALLDMGLPIGIPEIRSTPIDDRAGNAYASVAVFSIRGLGLPLAFDERDSA
jgi:hypothetical protein